jgi:hypothetical protein
MVLLLEVQDKSLLAGKVRLVALGQDGRCDGMTALAEGMVLVARNTDRA